MLITLVVLQDVAAYIKKEFDKKHNPTWQVDERALYKLSRPLSPNSHRITPPFLCQACHRRPQFRKLRDPRNKTLYLLLSGTGGHFTFQIWLMFDLVREGCNKVE
jgi:TPP-dependent indolepyruvate ferredoxin oxidoreductase alpha subunit